MVRRELSSFFVLTSVAVVKILNYLFVVHNVGNRFVIIILYSLPHNIIFDSWPNCINRFLTCVRDRKNGLFERFDSFR